MLTRDQYCTRFITFYDIREFVVYCAVSEGYFYLNNDNFLTYPTYERLLIRYIRHADQLKCYAETLFMGIQW